MLAHQDFDQIAGRLDGAMRNVGFRMAFTLDRDDAEYAAKIFGKPNLIFKDGCDSIQASEFWHHLKHYPADGGL